MTALVWARDVDCRRIARFGRTHGSQSVGFKEGIEVNLALSY